MAYKVSKKYFESPTEYFEYAHTCRNIGSNDWLRRRCFNGTDFNGKESDVYNKFVRHETSEQAHELDSIVNEIEGADFSEVRWVHASRLEEGDDVDVERYLSDEPTCWSGMRRSIKSRKVIRVFVNFGGNCDRSREELMIPGAIGVALCKAFESLGVNIELWGVTASSNATSDGMGHEIYIKIKGSDDFVDLGIVNYILGDSHTFRNTSFIAEARQFFEEGKTIRWNLGCAKSVSAESMELDEEERATTIVVPSIYKVDLAREYLIKKLNETVSAVK